MHLERIISGSPAVRRELKDCEVMQFWITDKRIEEIADAQRKRMKDTFGRTAIPFHVIVNSDGTPIYVEDDGERKFLEFEYPGNTQDYARFLQKAP